MMKGTHKAEGNKKDKHVSKLLRIADVLFFHLTRDTYESTSQNSDGKLEIISRSHQDHVNQLMVALG